MTIISGSNINNFSLVSPFDKNNLRRSSYDLSVGREYYLCNHGKKNDDSASVIKSIKLGKNQSMEIPPNAVCYIISKEKIKLPNNITARVSLRMSSIYNGLMLTVQPPFDPGYDGYAVAMLYNLSDSPVALKEGERFLTIEFFALDKVCDDALPKSSNILCLDQALKKRFRSTMDSLQVSVAEVKEDLNKKIDIFHKVIVFAMSLVTIVLAGGIALSGWGINRQNSELVNQGRIIEKLMDKQSRLEIALETTKYTLEEIKSMPKLAQVSTQPENVQLQPDIHNSRPKPKRGKTEVDGRELN